MTEKQLKRLIKQYKEAREELIEKILSVKGIGTKVYYNTVLKELNKIIKKLSKQTHEALETDIPNKYKQALDELYEYFKLNNLTMLPPNAFAQIHEDAVYDLVKEAEYHTDDALARVGRQVQRYLDVSRDEKLRQAGLKASAQKIATTSTIIDMQNSLEKELKSEGFMTVQYGSGKNAHQVPVETYVAMVARSTTREAGNLARENQLAVNGYDLVKMTEHYPTCAVCSALQGRVYSISGKDKRFRPLSDAFTGGYRNVHPNCRHAIGPWIERWRSPEEIEAESKKSLAPLDDARSPAERELYNKQQRQNREARQNYFQWKRYKERLGDDAPKSQLALERIKKKDGQEWEELQRKYRAAGVDKAGESGIINAGAISGAKKTPGWQERHAELMYEEIRHRKSDIMKIAQNTSFKESAVEEIKQHMFFEEHKFADGSTRRFDSDFDQAQAWDRLSKGEGTVIDIEMLKHEYVELTQMRLHGYDYETAHAIANSKHDWWSMVEKEG